MIAGPGETFGFARPFFVRWELSQKHLRQTEARNWGFHFLLENGHAHIY